MGRGPFMGRAAGPASALASLAGGAREQMDVEGIDAVAVYAALMSALVRTVFAQRMRLGLGPTRPGRGPARRALPGRGRTAGRRR